MCSFHMNWDKSTAVLFIFSLNSFTIEPEPDLKNEADVRQWMFLTELK